MGLLRLGLGGVLVVCAAGRAAGQTDVLDLVRRMAINENAAERHRANFFYLSVERSERTGGHLWTERVAETDAGKVRLLLIEDDHPLSTERQAAQRAKLKDIATHPDVFARREQAQKNDEHHAKEMLTLLPKAFLFDAPVKDGIFLRMAYRPNPAYSPQSLEERVLHGMSGALVVDPGAARLRFIEGRLPEDVNIGFGLVATIKAGSSFSTTRERETAEDWKTSALDTDIDGRAIFFKSIAKKQHAERRDYKRLSDNVTVPQAVEMLLR